MTSFDEALKILEKEDLIPEGTVMESENYFIFTTIVGPDGENIGNSCNYVVDRRDGTGRWVNYTEFPLPDPGEVLGVRDL